MPPKNPHSPAQKIIAPSILAADLSRLGDEVAHVISAGADWVHFDVMDNHYVPNLTFGPGICAALGADMKSRGIAAPLDVHLMVQPVQRIIPEFAAAGADYISFHPEAVGYVSDVARVLRFIRKHGCKCGLALNPDTPAEILRDHLPQLDLVLLMSVVPGFGGQKFIPAVLDKIRAARNMIDAENKTRDESMQIRLEVDGGVGVDNVAEISAAGADTFVAGSAIFGDACNTDANRYDGVIQKFRANMR